MPLERLETPYELINAPVTLWQQYPILIISVANLILLLLGMLLFQSVSLRRTKLAHAKVAASEKQVRESEARYRLLASNTKDVISTWNTATRSISYCSPSIQALTGFTPAEYMATPLAESMTAESFSQARQLMGSGSIESQVLEIEMYTKDGGTVWCEIVAQPLPCASGEPTEWVGVTRDISQRKASDAERQRLEHQVQQSQKIESIGTLAGGIAHDFNNILGVITGITDLLKVEFADHSRASPLLKNLMTACEKAKSLVGRILTFSRQSSGEKIVTNLPHLVEESLEILQAGIPKTLIIKKEIASNSLPVMADPTHIEQVIINLITNAAEAHGDQAGSISITVNSTHLDVEREYLYGRLAPGDYAMLRVTDNGVGMDAEHLAKIFEPFYTSKELGNGMGMAIVHGIVMDHHGAIDIQSQLGEGTTVSIYLPLTDEQYSPSVEPPEVTQTSQESRRIMVIDDQEDLLDTLSLMLTHLGHECLQFSNPRQALKVIQQQSHTIDLIITDYSMPELTGLELIEYCSKNHPTLPVILSTGYSDRIAERVAGEQNDFTVLNKPYNFAQLREVLRQAL